MWNGRFVLGLVMRPTKMRVLIQQIMIPAMSTVGYGAGIDLVRLQSVSFCGDRRPLADIQTAQNLRPNVPIIAVIEDWQVIGGDA
jgi:hypothetical protein